MMRFFMTTFIIVLTFVSLGCYYEVGYNPGTVIIQFFPDTDQENATRIMENISNHYDNFTIEQWNRYKYDYQRKEGTVIMAWEIYLNVPVGSEKWFVSELGRNETIYRAKLHYRIG